MVISHKHRYLFVELGQTASTAISKELCEHYDGVKILRKHARYHEFLKIATLEETPHFVFSCIRNPIDTVLSKYFIYKTDHRGKFSDPERHRKQGGHVTARELSKYNFVKNTNADFPTFFKKYYVLPYVQWSALSHKDFDFLIRYQNLQDDFAEVLSLLGIEPKRPIPFANKTGKRERDFFAYYTPDIRDRAKRVFGPYMKTWGYEFPPEWGDASVSWSTQTQFHILNVLRWRLHPHALGVLRRAQDLLSLTGGRKY